MVERRSSRARPGGSAQPVGSQHPRSAATPPSFAPTGKQSRPAPAGATPVGVPTRVMPQQALREAPHQHRTRPAGPTRPPAARTAPRRHRRRFGRVVAVVLVLVLAWPVGLAVWANGRFERIPALSDAAGTPGTTYLLAGSDSRADGGVPADSTEGARADTIMVLHVPSSGPSALISLPRDTYAEIPGYSPNKLNAAFAFGGAPLLVETVEGLTGLTVDHYVQIGMDGIAPIVDAVGGVELCLDYDVDDRRSRLTWNAGCHVADGDTALAFSRMRYADPTGDIGRTQRQQQLIGALSRDLADPAVLVNPVRQVELARAGTGALTGSEGTSILDLGQLALAFRTANGPEGIRGTPPIASMNYQPGGVGSTVLLDPDRAPAFFRDLREGTLEPGDVGGVS